MGEFERNLLPEIKKCDSSVDKIILQKYDELSRDGEITEAEDLYLQSMYTLKKKGVTGSVELQTEIFKSSFKPESLTCDTDETGQNVPQSYYDIVDLSTERIDGARKTLSLALDRLMKSKVFREKTGYKAADKQMLINKYFALMVKESFLDPKAISVSGAQGYFQLKDGAVTDAKTFLQAKINKTNTYDVNNSEDNCILGIIYYELQRSDLKGKELVDMNDLDKFTLFSYNAGPGNLRDLLDLYIGELGSDQVSWDSFAGWLSQRLGTLGEAKNVNDGVYGGEYRDWFNDKSFVGSTDLFIQGFTITTGKIYEAVNYVEKIDNIFRYDFSKDNNFGDEGIEGSQTESIESGDGRIEYLTRIIGSGESINVILDQEGLDRKHAKKIFEFNKELNPAFMDLTSPNKIPLDTPLYIPLWVSGFYDILDIGEKSKDAGAEKIKEGEFNFYAWLDSIEVISEELKGKSFVLDPGHGAPDLGAHPVARDGAGDPIPDLQSAIKVVNEKKGRTQRVKAGGGSDYLHVYESLVVVDISYRLALLLKQHGADVHITRYNKKTGIVSGVNPTTPGKNDDVYGDTGASWNFSKGGDKIRLRRGAQIANGIFDEFTEKGGNPEDIFFLSIHADSRGNKKNLPINYRFQWSGGGRSAAGKKLAKKLAENTVFRGEKGISGGQGLYIINPKFNKIPGSVLVELANMNNPGSAYLLRQSGTEKREDGSIISGRQQYAEALFQSIFKSFASDDN